MDYTNLYYISLANSGIKQIPLLLNNEVIFIYTDRDKAFEQSKKLKNNFSYSALEITEIANCSLFFSKMATVKLNKFLLNGEGQILKSSDFGYEQPENIVFNISERSNILNSQPRRKYGNGPKIYLSTLTHKTKPARLSESNLFIILALINICSLISPVLGAVLGEVIVDHELILFFVLFGIQGVCFGILGIALRKVYLERLVCAGASICLMSFVIPLFLDGHEVSGASIIFLVLGIVLAINFIKGNKDIFIRK